MTEVDANIRMGIDLSSAGVNTQRRRMVLRIVGKPLIITFVFS
jgi:hypothetical protein